MNIDTIFFIGPQGSGKGTQAKLLAARLGFFYWEMGGILREVAASGTELGNEVKELVDNGHLLGDDMLFEVINSRLSEVPKDKGVIFDGVPRTLGQAKSLLDMLRKDGRHDFVTIFIDIHHEESIKRILRRAEIEHRADDTKEKILHRLELYDHETVPVLDYLKEETTFVHIDGMPPIPAVEASIDDALELQ